MEAGTQGTLQELVVAPGGRSRGREEGPEVRDSGGSFHSVEGILGET